MAEDYNTGTGTLPDYYNFRNLLFTLWQELNNATVEYRVCNLSELKTIRKVWIKSYLRFFAQINDKQKLEFIEKDKRIFLQKLYNNFSMVSRTTAHTANNICRELMTNYGVFNIEGDEDEAW